MPRSPVPTVSKMYSVLTEGKLSERALGMSKTRPAGKALQTEVVCVPCACTLYFTCTLISLCCFYLQMSDLPGVSEMIHLVLINPQNNFQSLTFQV